MIQFFIFSLMQIQGQKQELIHREGTLHNFFSKLWVYYGTTVNFK